MATSMKRQVQRVKDDAQALLCPDTILRACDAAGHDWRLSLIDARDVLRYAMHGPTNPEVPKLAYHPIRRGRDEPRVMKRRRDCYTLMTRPRETLRQKIAAKILNA